MALTIQGNNYDMWLLCGIAAMKYDVIHGTSVVKYDVTHGTAAMKYNFIHYTTAIKLNDDVIHGISVVKCDIIPLGSRTNVRRSAHSIVIAIAGLIKKCSLYSSFSSSKIVDLNSYHCSLNGVSYLALNMASFL
eukprot:scpid34358/ scgid5357/ 